MLFGRSTVLVALFNLMLKWFYVADNIETLKLVTLFHFTSQMNVAFLVQVISTDK